jgi:hypothetical protein
MGKRQSGCEEVFFLYNPSLFAICTKYNKQMGGNRNKRGGRELSSAHPYVGGARPGMGTGRSYKLTHVKKCRKIHSKLDHTS